MNDSINQAETIGEPNFCHAIILIIVRDKIIIFCFQESGRQQIASAGTEKTKSKSEDQAPVGAMPKMPDTAVKGVGDVEKNPVFDSIARYLGIDLSTEGRAARNRRGVAIVVNGPPLSGKSRAAVALAKYYECALLTIDSIVIDAIANSTTSAAAKARQLCAEVAVKYAEELRALESIELGKLGTPGVGPAAGLSVEALAQHSISRKLTYFFWIKLFVMTSDFKKPVVRFRAGARRPQWLATRTRTLKPLRS